MCLSSFSIFWAFLHQLLSKWCFSSLHVHPSPVYFPASIALFCPSPSVFFSPNDEHFLFFKLSSGLTVNLSSVYKMDTTMLGFDSFWKPLEIWFKLFYIYLLLITSISFLCLLSNFQIVKILCLMKRWCGSDVTLNEFKQFHIHNQTSEICWFRSHNKVEKGPEDLLRQ